MPYHYLIQSETLRARVDRLIAASAARNPHSAKIAQTIAADPKAHIHFAQNGMRDLVCGLTLIHAAGWSLEQTLTCWCDLTEKAPATTTAPAQDLPPPPLPPLAQALRDIIHLVPGQSADPDRDIARMQDIASAALRHAGFA